MENNSNELLIKNETEYIYENYLKLTKFNMYKRQKVVFSLLVISFGVLIFCSLAMCFWAEYARAIIYGVVAIVFLVIISFLPQIQAKRFALLDKKAKANTLNIFYFYNDRIEITNNENVTSINYQDIYLAYEDKGAFYIYLNKSQIIILSKYCFKIGDSSKLNELLKQKLGKKFKVKNKIK